MSPTDWVILRRDLVYFHVMYACVSAEYLHKSTKYQPSPEEGAGSPGAGAIGGCEPPDMDVGS